jgi:hypothetical protein
MSQNIYVARSSEVASRIIGAEMVIMSVRDSTLFVLDEAATWIWNAADGSTPLAEIVERSICAEFEVEPEEAMRDAEALVQDLARHGILLTSGEPIESTGVTPPKGEARP